MTGSQGRGAERWPITVKNTAVIVVDMQNVWVHPRGVRYLPMSEDIVPRIQELLRFCRSKRVPLLYLHTTKRKDLADVGIFADIKPQTHNPGRINKGISPILFSTTSPRAPLQASFGRFADRAGQF